LHAEQVARFLMKALARREPVSLNAKSQAVAWTPKSISSTEEIAALPFGSERICPLKASIQRIPSFGTLPSPGSLKFKLGVGSLSMHLDLAAFVNGPV